VTLHRDQVQVQLSLHHDVSALAIPVQLCSEVTEVLTRRRGAPPVLAHPYAPEHRIVLSAERYAVRLPRTAGVHPITGALLPPTVTPRGPITWARPRRTPCDCAAKLIFLGRCAPCWASASPEIGQLAVRRLPES
jgi:hypothetical protein